MREEVERPRLETGRACRGNTILIKKVLATVVWWFSGFFVCFLNCSINNKPISQDEGRGLCYMTGTESFQQHLKTVISVLVFSKNLDYRRTKKKGRKKPE